MAPLIQIITEPLNCYHIDFCTLITFIAIQWTSGHSPAVFCGFWLKFLFYSVQLFSLFLSCVLLQIKRQIASPMSSACESTACPIQLFPKGSFMEVDCNVPLHNRNYLCPSPSGWSQNKLNQWKTFHSTVTVPCPYAKIV